MRTSKGAEEFTLPGLAPSKTSGARVQQTGPGRWLLEIPAGEKGHYRLAQLDDYGKRPRTSFPWQPPLQMSVKARSGEIDYSGTWGFGLWNNPFGMAIIRGVELLRLPALPNAAWFFFASQHNYLSLQDDLPANGSLAAVFRSPRLPAPLLALGLPALPLALLPPGMRLLRRLASRLVGQASVLMRIDPTEWHTYTIDWRAEGISFQFDGLELLRTSISPSGPLGLVMWIDNQYMALRPNGKAAFGTLPNPRPAWIELSELELKAA
jgi:hypothetical protein